MAALTFLPLKLQLDILDIIHPCHGSRPIDQIGHVVSGTSNESYHLGLYERLHLVVSISHRL